MPKRSGLKTSIRKHTTRDVVAKSMPKDKVASKLSITPDNIRQWKSEIIPDGSGLPAEMKYEKMSTHQLNLEYERLQAVAKMYLIEQVIDRAPYETDLSKISGALKDLSTTSKEVKESEGKGSAWGDMVDKTIKEVLKKNPTINLIQNQQVNNGKD